MAKIKKERLGEADLAAEKGAGEETATPNVEKSSKNSVVVEWVERGNPTSRVYSLEAHGENYEELAKGFAEKKGGIVK